MRLVDTDAIKLPEGFFENVDNVPKFYEWLNTLPTIDPVQHGKWISLPHKSSRICSRCEHDEPYKFADEDADVFDYCPHCGAKMDVRYLKIANEQVEYLSENERRKTSR